jgi:GTP-binding protein
MHIKTATFVISNTEPEKCPAPRLPEYAFIGRSNVGKSSLINMLTGRQRLAKTSARPGKTQLINHFLINETWYLVDLPGYGYAKVGKSERANFQKLTPSYISARTNLMCLFCLIDIRLEPQPIDIQFLTWLGENQVPFVILFTKGDKLGVNQQFSAVTKYKKFLLQDWEELPPSIITSAESGQGREEVLKLIEETNKSFRVL